MHAVEHPLTREQYKALLLRTRARGQEKLYLLVKVFAILGIPVQSLEQLTIQALRDGVLTCTYRGQTRQIPIPRFLHDELSAYAHRQGIREGPVFRGVAQEPMTRNAASVAIARLGDEAGLPDGAATPTNLAQLSRQLRAEIEQDLESLCQRTYESLLAAEQAEIGWDVGEEPERSSR